ncbi:hypothetical protein SAMN03159463_02674 [Mesorhizobium sp. NFR06]|uniref:hypothetical protein n=1 Tax=Mesorhizobium sp. NFR06 TaxID=1566290 RepID=UPI0008ECBFF7|nr:hypothetical protein [Mesorhizobium sp. NFR06]SFO68382.1 hypothetical protein SAMN03159463_02674 [Mesorhizobium sp. NFR06]
MAQLSPKHLMVMLLAVLLTAGFSLSAAQASVMSARMAGENAMAMPAAGGMGKMAGGAMDEDCKACLKDLGSKGGPMHCPPDCVAPVLAVLPQGPAIRIAPRMQQPPPPPASVLRGRSLLPDPSPPDPLL